MKTEIVAGDTLDFATDVPDYPSSDGWTLNYRLMPRDSGTAITFQASTYGDGYRVQVGNSTTESWVAGNYSWFAYLTKPGMRVSVDSGELVILANPATSSTYDTRSHNQKVLDAINAVLENRATQDQMAYSIGGRSLSRMPIADLLTFKSNYEWFVKNDENRERIAAGLPNPRTVGVRFGR